MQYIYEGAFYKCENLKKIDLNEGLLGIDKRAFQETSSLKELTIPKTVNYLGYQMLNSSDCETLTFEDGFTTDNLGGDHAFEQSRLKTISIPD